MPGCSSSLSNKINATGSTNPLIWTALAENSPGRQSWVSHIPTSSPVGTAENVPGCNPGLLSPQHGLFAIRGSHPGLASWDILSRPYGTSRASLLNPGLTSWVTLSRPYGTDRDLPDS